jgi:aryl-alcohol dehydrogenase-like predicted oxidoreductase
MEYRALGKTGISVSAIGLGAAQLGTASTEYALQIIHRAVELGVTYFDTARGYWDSEVKLGLALQGQREAAIISTKTWVKTRDEAMQQIEESLGRLRTDYVDNCHLHALQVGEDMDARLGPGGALEALIEAKEQGIVRHIGCTAHTCRALIEALHRYDFEVILVPMNIVNREPLRELVPLCQEKGVGVTIMKPVATGLLPATVALKWLLNQPIATAVPGTTTLEELEENVRVGHNDYALTARDRAQIVACQAALERVRCRLCDECLPCPQEIALPLVLGSDVMYDHYRTMGGEDFGSFPWSRAAIERDLPNRHKVIAQIESCTRCGACEARCPHRLPMMDMLQSMVPVMVDMVTVYEGFLQA